MYTSCSVTSRMDWGGHLFSGFVMALYTELAVYRDTYLLILRVFEITKEFNKEYKYTTAILVAVAQSFRR